jgi:cellobiose-specific phosphotransferase system component IIB
MTSDDRIAAARCQLAEVEAATLQAVATARACLAVVEEENHELRREALERQQRYYTELEVAGLWKVSESTIARMRRARRFDYTLVGIQVRYTEAQAAQVGEAVMARGHQFRKTG